MYGTYGNQGPRSYKSLPAWKHALILAINGLGFSGAVLIVYGLGVVFTGNTYAPFEKYAGPDNFSKFVSAPTVIIAIILTLWLMLFSSAPVPAHVVNGFALLGLAGGLFRTISRA